MSSWALASGSDFPPLVPGKLRLYSMRFCPYAQRALLILQAKSIDHEVVNINLKDRPEWSKDVLPAGSLPVLAQVDKLISGSIAIAEYLEEAYPETRAMLPKDPYLKALDRSFLDAALPAVDSVVSVLMERGLKKDNWAALLRKISLYEEELARRKTAFFTGQEPGFVDYVTWPAFVLAHGISAVHKELEMPSAETFPHFSRWSESMREDRCVMEVVNEEYTVLFVQSYVTGQRDFNAGLH
ncbi:glutathione S-transferase omega-1-like [Amblyomma americanum]